MDQRRRSMLSFSLMMLCAMLASMALQKYLIDTGRLPSPNRIQPPPQPPPAVTEAFDLESVKNFKAEVTRLQKMVKAQSDSPVAGWALLRIGYLRETKLNDRAAAQKTYDQVSRKHNRTPYAPVAAYRRGLMDFHSEDEATRQKGIKELKDADNMFPKGVTYEESRQGKWRPVPLSHAVGEKLDPIHRHYFLYQVMDFFVRLTGANPKYSFALALVFLTVIIKLLLHPLSHAQYKSMKGMQTIQPEIKKIQERYKGDKANPAKMNAEIMEAYRRAKVNPWGGCLPMLIQMPVLIILYQAIILYKFRFNQAEFLWVKNLAQPDIPLLILYVISMIVSSKLTMLPSTDPQQEQTQKLMTYVMPIMFAFIFKSFPAAFLLYWLIFNIASTGQQLYILRVLKHEEERNRGNTPGLKVKSVKPDPTPPDTTNVRALQQSTSVPRRPSYRRKGKRR